MPYVYVETVVGTSLRCRTTAEAGPNVKSFIVSPSKGMIISSDGNVTSSLEPTAADIGKFLMRDGTSPLGISWQAVTGGNISTAAGLGLVYNAITNKLDVVGSNTIAVNTTTNGVFVTSPAGTAAGLPLLSNGPGNQSVYAALNLGSGFTGVLPVANGGTGSSAIIPQNDFVIAGANGVLIDSGINTSSITNIINNQPTSQTGTVTTSAGATATLNTIPANVIAFSIIVDVVAIDANNTAVSGGAVSLTAQAAFYKSASGFVQIGSDVNTQNPNPDAYSVTNDNIQYTPVESNLAIDIATLTNTSTGVINVLVNINTSNAGTVTPNVQYVVRSRDYLPLLTATA